MIVQIIADTLQRRLAVIVLMQLINYFDARFLAFAVLSAYMGLKGAAGSLVRLSLLPLFKNELAVTNSALYTRLLVIVMLPWSMKPLMGVITDFLAPNKARYVLCTSVCGTAAMVAVAAGTAILTPTAVAFLLFVVNVQFAWVDLCTEARYAEYMAEVPETGGMLVSYVWGAMFCAQTVAIAVGGVLADAGRTDIILWMCCGLCAQIIGPTLAGWLVETARVPGTRDDNLIVVACAITFSACGLTGVMAVNNWKVELAYAVVSAAGLSAVAYRYLPRTIARANQYLFASSLLYLSFPGNMDFFFTSVDPTCVPDGPAFSLTYYITVLGLAGSLAGVLGILIIQGCFHDASFRRMFWCTTVVKCLASVFDYAIVRRLNVGVIPDKYFMLMGSGIAIPLAQTLDGMPAVVLISKLCPKNKEAVLYAILAGYQNYGSALSVVLGSSLSELAGVKFNDDVCTYARFPLLILAGNMIIPLLCLPLAYWLIPDVAMTAKTLT